MRSHIQVPLILSISGTCTNFLMEKTLDKKFLAILLHSPNSPKFSPSKILYCTVSVLKVTQPAYAVAWFEVLLDVHK